MFSDREQKVIKILGKKKLSLTGIGKKLFIDEATLDANIKVGNTINRIIRKCKHHKLNWILVKHKESYPMSITKEMK